MHYNLLKKYGLSITSSFHETAQHYQQFKIILKAEQQIIYTIIYYNIMNNQLKILKSTSYYHLPLLDWLRKTFDHELTFDVVSIAINLYQ